MYELWDDYFIYGFSKTYTFVRVLFLTVILTARMYTTLQVIENGKS